VRKALSDGCEHCYKNVFVQTAIESLKKQFSLRNEDKKQYDCKIIQKHLKKENYSNV
jgi:hypothetical protein